MSHGDQLSHALRNPLDNWWGCTKYVVWWTDAALGPTHGRQLGHRVRFHGITIFGTIVRLEATSTLPLLSIRSAGSISAAGLVWIDWYFLFRSRSGYCTQYTSFLIILKHIKLWFDPYYYCLWLLLVTGVTVRYFWGRT